MSTPRRDPVSVDEGSGKPRFIITGSPKIIVVEYFAGAFDEFGDPQ